MDSKRLEVSKKRDPVCGMTVEPVEGAFTCTHNGQQYYFCAPGCRRAFEENPAKYLASKKRKGWWGRYLERMKKANQEVFGPSGPQCH